MTCTTGNDLWSIQRHTCPFPSQPPLYFCWSEAFRRSALCFHRVWAAKSRDFNGCAFLQPNHPEAAIAAKNGEGLAIEAGYAGEDLVGGGGAVENIKVNARYASVDQPLRLSYRVIDAYGEL